MRKRFCLLITLSAIAGAAEPPFSYDGKMKEWNDYIQKYSPDYSDSSACLLPPVTNRFSTPFAVVKDGHPAAEIVVSDTTCLPVEETAAAELQKAVEQMTGVRLPIVHLWSGALGKKGLRNRIVLGKSLHADDAVLKRLSGSDGYAIERDGDKLYVYGFNSKGVLNGVFALLENNTDIIWARPHSQFGTVFTPRKDLDFIWGDRVVERPASVSRGWNGYADLEWMARNKCNGFYGGGGGDISWMNARKIEYGTYEVLYLFGHNIGHFVRSKKYFKDHPEYYSLVNGERRPWRQYCFSNPEMKKVFIENALEFLRRAPENINGMHIDMDDTWEACECEKCLAPIRLPNGTVVTKDDPAFRSTQYFLFLNDVVAATKKEFPDVFIKTLAYFSTATPPKCEVDPMIRPTFAPYVRANDKRPIYAPENIVWLKSLREWRKVSPKIDCYEYYGLGLEFPRPLSEVRARDIPEMYRYLLGMGSEYKHGGDRDTPGGASKIWDYSAMEFWVLTRLLWNPGQDVEQLRKYYIRRTFREAAPMIEKFYGTIRREWFKSPRASTCCDNPVELTKYIIQEPGIEKELRGYLADAGKAVKHPVSAELVKRLSERFEFYCKAASEVKTSALSIPLLRPEGKVGFDHEIWNGAAKIDDFKKAYTQGKVPSVHRSEALLFHDSKNLYMNLKFYDPDMKKLNCKTPPPGKKNDFIPESDHAEIFLCDPANPGTYYLFSVDPHNVSSELKGMDSSWNGPWEHEVRTFNDRWEVLVKIPLSTIHADGAGGNLLRGTILREYHKHGTDGNSRREYSSWGGANHHQTMTFGTLNLMR